MQKLMSMILTLAMLFAFIVVASADPPPNNDCVNADDAGTLTAGTPVQLSGTTVDATIDCGMMGIPEVWISFTVPYCMDVTIDYCDNPSMISFVSEFLFTECPCMNLITAATHSYCDGNHYPKAIWRGLEAGTYYYPITVDMEMGAGPYTINVVGDTCVPLIGACCLNSGMECVDGVTEIYCIYDLGGYWKGEGSECGNFDSETGYEGCETTSNLGACCYSYGQGCMGHVPENDCIYGFAGIWMGPGSECGIFDNETGLYTGCDAITPTGACCRDNGMTCDNDISQDSCENFLGGSWIIGNTCGNYDEENGWSTCNPINPIGACCFNGGMDCIATVTFEECMFIYNGEFLGEGTDCGLYDEETGWSACNSTPATGACCFNSGMECIDGTTLDECLGMYTGNWMGEGTACGSYDEETGWSGCNSTSPTGACCFDDGFQCQSDVPEMDCVFVFSGTWMGEGTDCGTYDEETGWSGCEINPPTGACCFENGFQCQSDLTEMGCINLFLGTWLGEGTDCGTYDEETGWSACNSTPATGACCFNSGMNCVDGTTLDECLGMYSGTWMGEGTACGSYDEETGWSGCNSTSPTGACCFDDGFQCQSDVPEMDCVFVFSGTWMGEGTDCGTYDEETGWSGCQVHQYYEYLPGDANMTTGIWPPATIGGDVTYLVNYFRGITAACMLDGFYASADANGDCRVTGADVTKLVSYFRGMDDLSHCPDYPTTWPPIPDTAPDGWPNCASPVLSK